MVLNCHIEGIPVHNLGYSPPVTSSGELVSRATRSNSDSKKMVLVCFRVLSISLYVIHTFY